MSNPLDQPELPTPSRTPRPDDADPSPSQANPEPSATAQHNPPLSIEAGIPAATAAAEDDTVQSLDLGKGDIVRLDKLGPMIINSDGTLSRIQNWHELHPIEQERTVRLLVKKRNIVRMQKLDQDEEAAGGEAGADRGDKVTALKEASSS